MWAGLAQCDWHPHKMRAETREEEKPCEDTERGLRRNQLSYHFDRRLEVSRTVRM